MGDFFFQKIHFPGLPLLILCGIIRLFFAFRLEDFAILGVVAGVFTMERAIHLGILFLAFLTMLVLSFELEAIFFFLVSLSSSEAANFAPAMLSVVSARS